MILGDDVAIAGEAVAALQHAPEALPGGAHELPVAFELGDEDRRMGMVIPTVQRVPPAHELQALRGVSDALVGFQRNRELLTSRAELLTAASQAQSLAELRYQGGTSSYLEVLDASSRRLDAEFALVRARLDALLSYVEVYRALGGGWEA